MNMRKYTVKGLAKEGSTNGGTYTFNDLYNAMSFAKELRACQEIAMIVIESDWLNEKGKVVQVEIYRWYPDDAASS